MLQIFELKLLLGIVFDTVVLPNGALARLTNLSFTFTLAPRVAGLGVRVPWPERPGSAGCEAERDLAAFCAERSPTRAPDFHKGRKQNVGKAYESARLFAE